jgi:hypothetical protein
MRRASSLLLALLLACTAPAALAAEPPCLGADAILADASDPTGGWLVKEPPEKVRLRFERLAGKRWRGDTLLISCGLQGPATDVPLVDVLTRGGGVAKARGGKALFQRLAADADRSPQEADVLAGRYARLERSFFRTLPDGQGGSASEDELILGKQARALGLPDPDEGSEETDDEPAGEDAALAKRIEAAEARGDLAEVMRLGAGAQAGLAQRGRAAADGAARDRWLLLQQSAAPLADAAYQTLVVRKASPCQVCRWPDEVPGRP